jgi:hypothetical protein
MITALGLDGKIQIVKETVIAGLKADIRIIFRDGFPVGVMEVKKPGGDLNLHYGQVYDCLLQVRSFYGVKDVFGILTNYTEWKICWLPDSTDRARATTALGGFNNDIVLPG